MNDWMNKCLIQEFCLFPLHSTASILGFLNFWSTWARPYSGSLNNRDLPLLPSSPQCDKKQIHKCTVTIQCAKCCNRCKCRVSWKQVRNASVPHGGGFPKEIVPKMSLKWKGVGKRNKGGGKFQVKGPARGKAQKAETGPGKKHKRLWWLCPGWKGGTVRGEVGR